MEIRRLKKILKTKKKILNLLFIYLIYIPKSLEIINNELYKNK